MNSRAPEGLENRILELEELLESADTKVMALSVAVKILLEHLPSAKQSLRTLSSTVAAGLAQQGHLKTSQVRDVTSMLQAMTGG